MTRVSQPLLDKKEKFLENINSCRREVKVTGRNCAVKMSNGWNGAQGHSYLRVRQYFLIVFIREMFEKYFSGFESSSRTFLSGISMNISSWLLDRESKKSLCSFEVSM